MCIPKIISPRLVVVAPSMVGVTPSSTIICRKMVRSPPTTTLVKKTRRQFATLQTPKEKRVVDHQDTASTCPALTYISIITFFAAILLDNCYQENKKNHAWKKCQIRTGVDIDWNNGFIWAFEAKTIIKFNQHQGIISTNVCTCSYLPTLNKCK